ncbi:unnamed protein product [Pedinophyceae sp. YPF-701]|nr:unnamed protein product [Pedinophyceae sp. YPF-701]
MNRPHDDVEGVSALASDSFSREKARAEVTRRTLISPLEEDPRLSYATEEYSSVIERFVQDHVAAPRMIGKDTRATITVAGGGNAAHVVLALLGSNPNFTVQLWDTLSHEVEAFRAALAANGGMVAVEHPDGKPDTLGRVAKVSSDPADLLPATDLLLLSVPAPFHGLYLERAVPHLHEDMHVGCMVAEGGFDWQALSYVSSVPMLHGARLSIFAMETLPWACKIVEYGRKARISGVKEDVDISVFPRAAGREVAQMINDLIGTQRQVTTKKGTALTEHAYPQLNATTFIESTLMNINSVWHPCITYARFGPHAWDQKTPFAEPPLFYEGVGDIAGNVLTGVSNEVMAVRRALEQAAPHLDLHNVHHVREWVLRAYKNDIADKSTLATSIATNRAYVGYRHPMREVAPGQLLPDERARYMSEDVPFGLAVTKGIAEIVAVETPCMDRVIAWCQGRMGKEYVVGGHLRGKDVLETRAPQRFGITSLAALLRLCA